MQIFLCVSPHVLLTNNPILHTKHQRLQQRVPLPLSLQQRVPLPLALQQNRGKENVSPVCQPMCLCLQCTYLTKIIFSTEVIVNSHWLKEIKPVVWRWFLFSCRFLEEFDTISRVGKGGYGSVYKARRKLEDTFFAVKIVKYDKWVHKIWSSILLLLPWYSFTCINMHCISLICLSSMYGLQESSQRGHLFVSFCPWKHSALPYIVDRCNKVQRRRIRHFQRFTVTHFHSFVITFGITLKVYPLVLNDESPHTFLFLAVTVDQNTFTFRWNSVLEKLFASG